MEYYSLAEIEILLKKDNPDNPFSKYFIKAFVKTNNIDYKIVDNQYVVNLNQFMEKLNPKHIDKPYQPVKLMVSHGFMENYNVTHINKIDLPLLKRILNNNVPYIKLKSLYFFNYYKFIEEWKRIRNIPIKSSLYYARKKKKSTD